jgi:hypothetical protein
MNMHETKILTSNIASCKGIKMDTGQNIYITVTFPFMTQCSSVSRDTGYGLNDQNVTSRRFRAPIFITVPKRALGDCPVSSPASAICFLLGGNRPNCEAPHASAKVWNV